MSLEEIQKLIQKSEHALKAAENLMKEDYPSDAASKAYYAMFYAVRALLLSIEIDVSKRRGETISDFLNDFPTVRKTQAVIILEKLKAMLVRKNHAIVA
jgi:uncharacterized protein (UPF0332 family)